MEVASFHARKLPTIILFKHLNFFNYLKKYISSQLLKFQSVISNVQLSHCKYTKFCKTDLKDKKVINA